MNVPLKYLRELPRAHRAVFLFAFAAALLFAAFTNHVWEDYYITYRASKNLATGHGLVFNVGDRLHTFTSPLGVLLPALASVLTLNRSDTAALWIFRVLSAAAFAGAATFLYASLLSIHRRVLVAGCAVAWLVLDAKALDFTINGMETGFLLLFVAWTLWAQFGECSRRWLWLGLGWAGLMWTRPDGFLYIGLLALGGFLFSDSARSGLTRLALLKLFLFAGLVCTAVYLPWFLGSWIYYGTPIPHTIIAKAAATTGRTFGGAFRSLAVLPWKVWTGDTSLPATFLPSYYAMGGWPTALGSLAKGLGFIVAFAWLAPVFRSPTRAASFAFFGLHWYLSYFPNFLYPWYLPGTAILGYFVLAGMLAASLSGRLKPAVLVGGVLLIGLNAWLCFEVGRQVAAGQKWIEDGNRRKIGDWLRAHAEPGDTVFLEPLGYISYFSNLKTYDFPGLSSREMTDAIRKLGTDWASLIDFLRPDWIVLRYHEAAHLNTIRPDLLNGAYLQADKFDVLDEVEKLPVRGRPLLKFDAYFAVYHRSWKRPLPVELVEMRSPFPVAKAQIDNVPMNFVHAPATVIYRVPPAAVELQIAYGFPAGAYDSGEKTDGARFEIKWVSGPREKILLSRQLDPAANPADRGAQKFAVTLPHGTESAQLILSTQTGATPTRDWTCWSAPNFFAP